MGAIRRPDRSRPPMWRRVLGPGLLLALVATGAACNRPTNPPIDQTPPKGTNGVVYRNGELWIADLTGGQIIVVDPATGAIRARYGAESGITGQVDDLAIAADGTVYWTGYDTGIIGRMRPGQKSTTLATIAPGVNPIAIAPDGHLYVGRAMTGDGLYHVDTVTGAVRTVAPSLGSPNAFAFGADGQLYAPAMDLGSLIRIDPLTGSHATLAEGFVQPDAVRFPVTRLGTKDYSSVYVLCAYPVKVWKVDLGTGATTVVKDTLPNPVGDNMAFAPDGRLFVTAYNRPSISVIAPDGSVSTISVGTPPGAAPTTAPPRTATTP
jgi:sugar lactone lactonase YvrE